MVKNFSDCGFLQEGGDDFHIPATMRAARRIVQQTAVFVIDDRLKVVGRPDTAPAVVDALQMVDGAVAFVNQRLLEASALELPIDIAGEHPHAMQHL